MTEENINADAARADRELMLDRDARVEATQGDGQFGRLGPRFDRGSPFYAGLFGGLGVAAAFVVAWAVYSARGVLLLIGLALFIAVGLEPVVARLHRLGTRRGVAVLIVVLVAVAVLGGVLALAIPPLSTEVNLLIKKGPGYVQDLNNRSSFLGHLNHQYHIEAQVKKALTGGGLSSAASGVLGAGKVVFGAVTSVVVVILLTIYFLAGLPRVTRMVYRLVPHSRRARTGLLIDEAFARVGGFVLGNVLTSVIAGVGTFIWLEIFGIPYPVLLSVFVALMDLIPIVGSTIAGVIVALVALTVSLPVAIATAVYYLVYRQAEDYLITPRVMRRTVEVPGLVTVIAVLLGGALLGIIGALIAIPVAAAIKLVLEEVTFPRLDTG